MQETLEQIIGMIDDTLKDEVSHTSKRQALMALWRIREHALRAVTENEVEEAV